MTDYIALHRIVLPALTIEFVEEAVIGALSKKVKRIKVSKNLNIAVSTRDVRVFCVKKFKNVSRERCILLPMLAKKKILGQLFSVWAGFNPVLRIDGDQLVVIHAKRALELLERTYMDLLAFGVFKVDEKTNARIMQNKINEEAYQLVMAKELADLTEMWDQMGITAILLKGLSLKHYYPVKCIRPASDLDFLIHPRDKQIVLTAMKKTQYVPILPEDKIQDRINRHGELGWRNPRTKMKVECHWDIISSPSMRWPINYDPDFVFRHTELMNIDLVPHPVRALSITMNLVYLMCHHILHHQYRGLFWLADILLLAGNEKMDWTEFEHIVRYLKVEKPVHFYLQVLESLFGKDGATEISQIKQNLAPQSISYRFFTRLYSPYSIFKHTLFFGKLRAKLFRNAFK